MIRKLSLFSFMALLMLSGCATRQTNVALDQHFWQQKNQTVKVALAKADKPTMLQEGQEGLLDLAINSVVTSSFDTHLKNSSMRWYQDLQNKFVSRLRAKGMHAQAVSSRVKLKDLSDSNKPSDASGKGPVYAKQNFRPLGIRFGADRLLLVQVESLGALRHYVSVFPEGPPKAICNLNGRLIDTKTNKVLWRYYAAVNIPVAGEWSQPPKYPNFDIAMNKATTIASNELLDNFFSD